MALMRDSADHLPRFRNPVEDNFGLPATGMPARLGGIGEPVRMFVAAGR